MKSVLTYGISWLPVGGRERALAEPRAAVAAVRDRVQRLHELVARAVLAEGEPAGLRAEHLVVGPGLQPDRHALADVGDLVVGGPAADGEERRGRRATYASARRGDVEHRQEDPEVEEPRAEVVRDDEDEHRAAPDQQQRGHVLQPALREHLALLAQVRRQEDDQRDLRQLAGLELEPADVAPTAARRSRSCRSPGCASNTNLNEYRTIATNCFTINRRCCGESQPIPSLSLSKPCGSLPKLLSFCKERPHNLSQVEATLCKPLDMKDHSSPYH